ncbi:MucBP domain-containing protein [Enterococcus faecalis]
MWIVGGIFLGVEKVEAAPRPLTELGYFHWANQSITPAANTFIMHYGENTSVEPIEGEVYSNYMAVSRTTNKSKALVKNVGFYEGKAVNLLVTLQRNKSNLDGGSISFTESYFLGITIKGEMLVTYDFVDNDGQPLTIKTAFNYYGLNSNKYVGYKNPGTIIDALYAENPTHILYDTWDGGDDDYWLYLKNVTAGVPWRDPRQRFEMTTKSISTVTFVVHNNDTTPSSIVYFTDFLAKPEFPPAYAMDTYFENAETAVCLNVQQTIPNIDQWTKPSQMVVNVNLNQVNQTKQYQFDKVLVTDFKGEDLTDLFTSQTDGENVQIMTKNLSDSRFYDTVLQYKVYLKWQGTQNPVDTALISSGKLDLPFSARTLLDGENLEETTATSSVNYVGKATAVFLNEQDNAIHEPVTKEGILTTPFDLSNQYPKIAGYEPIKTQQDQGMFLSEEQTIIHRYREKKLLQFKLMDEENPLLVSRFTNQREVTFSFSHDPSTNITLIAKCGTEEKELKKYVDAPESVVDKVTYTFPEHWLNREVFFYIKDENNQESEKDSRTLQKEAGPKLILPDTINFGVNEIPATETMISSITNKEIRIEDTSKLDKSRWTIKVKEEQPLKNESGELLDKRISYGEKNQRVLINADSQPILQGSGNATANLTKQLQLTIFPSDSVGRYSGVLRWSLEDAPE